MSEPPTFVIGEVTIRPEVPETWSFSALRGFEECPMRWALSRTAISCFGGPVPQKPNRSSVEGSLLHALLERFARHAMQDGTEVFRPRRTLLEMVAGWARDNARNPRVDSKMLAGQVRLEEILRSFVEARPHLKIVERRRATASSSGKSGGVFEGPESWLRDPGSKLCGRADLISSGEIVDFKSGEQQNHHVEQIGFYGALYFAQSGRAPTVLRLIYTGTNEVREVPVLTLNELKLLLEEMRRRAAAAERQVVGGELPAKPEPGRCEYCHVRGLCDTYWRLLRHGGQNLGGGQSQIIDYAPSAAAKIESAALGVYVRDKFADTASVLHLPQEVAEKMGNDVERLRVIAVRPSTGTEGIRFAFTQSSEVYVRG